MTKNRQTNKGFIWLSALVFILIGGLALFSLIKGGSTEETPKNDTVNNLLLTTEIAKNQQLVVSSERGYLLLKNVTFLKNKKVLNEEIETGLKKLSEQMTDAKEKELLEAAIETRTNYNQLMDYSIAETNNGNFDHSMELVKEASEFALTFEDQMSELADLQEESLQGTSSKEDTSQQPMTYVYLVLAVIGLVGTLIFGRK